MLYVYRIFMTSPLGVTVGFVVYLKRFIYQFLNVYPFPYTAVAGSGKVGPVNRLTTPVGAVITPTDRPTSVRNRTFCGVVCVVTLPF